MSTAYPEQTYFANGHNGTLAKAEAALLIGVGALAAGGVGWGLKKRFNSSPCYPWLSFLDHGGTDTQGKLVELENKRRES